MKFQGLTAQSRLFPGSSSAVGTATTPWTTSTSSRSPPRNGTTCPAGATCRPHAIATALWCTAAPCSSSAGWTSGRRASRTSASSASTRGGATELCSSIASQGTETARFEVQSMSFLLFFHGFSWFLTDFPAPRQRFGWLRALSRSWSKVKTTGDPPSARTFHRACMCGTWKLKKAISNLSLEPV